MGEARDWSGPSATDKAAEALPWTLTLLWTRPRVGCESSAMDEPAGRLQACSLGRRLWGHQMYLTQPGGYGRVFLCAISRDRNVAAAVKKGKWTAMGRRCKQGRGAATGAATRATSWTTPLYSSGAFSHGRRCGVNGVGPPQDAKQPQSLLPWAISEGGQGPTPAS